MQKGLLNIPEADEAQKGGDIPPDDLLRQFGIEGEEKQIFEAYLGNGMQLIHGRETRDKILSRINKDDPEGSLANAVGVVMDVLDSKAKGVSDMVRFLAGISMLGQIAEVAEAAGIAKFDDDARVLAMSKLLASQISKGIRSGKYNPQELKQAAQQAATKLKIDPTKGMAEIAQGASKRKSKGA